MQSAHRAHTFAFAGASAASCFSSSTLRILPDAIWGRLVFARAVDLHVRNRVLPYGNKTAVFAWLPRRGRAGSVAL